MKSTDKVCSTKGIEIDGKLGEGGQGLIFKGRHVKSEEVCAVKKANISGRKLSYYINEIEIMQRLNSHENIIQLQKAFVNNNSGYIVMEKLEIDLMDYILKKKILPENETKKIFKGICHGVLHCHRNNIAHLDLKPENILMNLSSTLEVKICDFGQSFNYSKFICHETRGFDSKKVRVRNAFRKVGTDQYRAPELMNPTVKFVDVTCADIWSLGIMLFVMITGLFPHVVIDKCSVDMAKVEERFHKVFYEEERRIIYLDFDLLKDKVSQECIDLLDLLLGENPNYRLNIGEVLQHPWLNLPTTAVRKGIPLELTRAQELTSSFISDPEEDLCSSPVPEITRYFFDH